MLARGEGTATLPHPGDPPAPLFLREGLGRGCVLAVWESPPQGMECRRVRIICGSPPRRTVKDSLRFDMNHLAYLYLTIIIVPVLGGFPLREPGLQLFSRCGPCGIRDRPFFVEEASHVRDPGSF